MPCHRIRDDSLPQNLLGPLLLSEAGLPRYWAMAWSIQFGNGLAEASLRQALTNIDQLYQHAQEILGRDELDDAINSLDFDRLAAVLQGFFVRIVNRSDRNEAGRGRIWKTALTFVRNCCELMISAGGGSTPLDILQGRLLHLDRLYGQLSAGKARSAETLRALPAGVVEDLYEIIAPDGHRNPFRSEDLRWRNFAIFLLLLHQGLRRGEALALPTDALKNEVDRRTGVERYWLDVDTNPYDAVDARYEPPGLKTANAVRQLPISRSIVTVIDTYVDNYRGRQRHSFLFASQKNNALSLRAVNEIMDSLSAALSNGARTELFDRRRTKKITPHDLRHTCAVMRLKQFVDHGDEQQAAIEKLRIFFGWSRTSEMPLLYAKAYFEDRLSTVWDRSFDDHVKLLRGLG